MSALRWGLAGVLATAGLPVGHEFVRLTVELWGGGQSVENMWGPQDGPLWRANDPLVNADRLRGTHSWGYWENNLRTSWPFLAQSIGAR